MIDNFFICLIKTIVFGFTLGNTILGKAFLGSWSPKQCQVLLPSCGVDPQLN